MPLLRKTVPCFQITWLHEISKNHLNMSLWSFLQHVEVICGSSIILQVVNGHLWIIFALLNDAHFYKNLDLQTMRPHMSKCTISKSLVVCISPPLENVALWCLSSMHASQTNKDVEYWIIAKIHTTHQALKCMNIITFKCSCQGYQSSNVIFFSWLYQISHIRSMHLKKA